MTLKAWGDGTQIRNSTYVDDIVRGMALAAERSRTAPRSTSARRSAPE
jgi:nucleoside-diphosphate-sugar epimerase